MKTIIALLCMIPMLAFSAERARICPQNTFSCLEHHMDDFYQADHHRFYRVYTHAFNKAMQCANYQDVANYLTIHSAVHDSAEIDESMEQDTEALLLLKPDCFFEGYLLLTPQQQENLVGSYRLFSRPNHVMQLLRTYMQGGKYQHIATLIYNKNLDAYQSYKKDADDAPMEYLYKKYK